MYLVLIIIAVPVAPMTVWLEILFSDHFRPAASTALRHGSLRVTAEYYVEPSLF